MSSIIQYGSWIIEVDLEKTQKYYQAYKNPEENQLYRNYKLYCESMPANEKTFFDNFGIDPLCCKPNTLGMTNEKTLPTEVYFYIAGKYIQTHKEEIITPEELAANNFIDSREDSTIYIGSFQFHFQNPEAVFHSIPEDIPEGFLCIRAWLDNLPWLLSEKCESKMWYPPQWWQLIKKYKTRKEGKIQYHNYIRKLKNDLESDFSSSGADFVFLDKKKRKKLILQWMNHFLTDVDKSIIKKCHIYGDHECSNYLWHSFSFKLISTEKEDNTAFHFSNADKSNCYVLFNNELIAYKLEKANRITTKIIDKYDDILVFDQNFIWTYCHTHEIDCGPYFHHKKNAPFN
jgi:hypothetical protein